MKLLLDTHVFLWYITGDERVPREFRSAIENAEAVYLSIASLWEIAIKHQLGKLPCSEPLFPWLITQRSKHGIESLALDDASIARLSSLETHHRDPFDRMLICQALVHDLTVITVDRAFERYPVSLLPART